MDIGDIGFLIIAFIVFIDEDLRKGGNSIGNC